MLSEGTFTSFFADNTSKRSHKTVGMKGFLTIFARWYKDQDPDSDPGGPKRHPYEDLHWIFIES